MTASELTGVLGFAAANLLAASPGAIFKPGDWYEGLNFPSWRPPNWLFPIAWAVLFAMIASAGWLVWHRAGFAGAGLALGLYGLQLVLNAAWSPIFFGLRRMDWALAELALLWLAIVATVLAFAPISPLAAVLMLPYLAWVSFAGVLNGTMWRLNGAAPRQALKATT